MATAVDRIELHNPKGYQEKLSSLLAGRNPLDVLAETPEMLAKIVADHSTAELRTRPFEGKWTPLEVLGHLADAEWVFGYRIRAILCDERPTLIGMDQERWVDRQRHNAAAPAELLATFSELRRFNLTLWRQMTPADLERCGQHAERGPESLGMMLRMEAGHDLSHIDQMRRYLAVVRAG
jgi:hypothetical protein